MRMSGYSCSSLFVLLMIFGLVNRILNSVSQGKYLFIELIVRESDSEIMIMILKGFV